MLNVPSAPVTARNGVFVFVDASWICTCAKLSGSLSRELTTRPRTSPVSTCAAPIIAANKRTRTMLMKSGAFRTTVMGVSFMLTAMGALMAGVPGEAVGG